MIIGLISLFLVFICLFFIYNFRNKIISLETQIETMEENMPSDVSGSGVYESRITTMINNTIQGLRTQVTNLGTQVTNLGTPAASAGSGDGAGQDLNYRVSSANELGYEIDSLTNEVVFNKPVRFNSNVNIVSNVDIVGNVDIEGNVDVTGSMDVGTGIELNGVSHVNNSIGNVIRAHGRIVALDEIGVYQPATEHGGDTKNSINSDGSFEGYKISMENRFDGRTKLYTNDGYLDLKKGGNGIRINSDSTQIKDHSDFTKIITGDVDCENINNRDDKLYDINGKNFIMNSFDGNAIVGNQGGWEGGFILRPDKTDLMHDNQKNQNDCSVGHVSGHDDTGTIWTEYNNGTHGHIRNLNSAGGTTDFKQVKSNCGVYGFRKDDGTYMRYHNGTTL